MLGPRSLRRLIAFGVVLALAAGGPVAAAQPDTQPLTYDGTLGLALFGGAIVSVALPAAVYKAPAGCRWCDAGNLNAIDRWARKARWDAPCRAGNLSDATLVVASAVALLPMSRESSGHDWLVNAGTVADSVAVTVMLTQAVKYTVRRERPAPTTCHPGRANEPDSKPVVLLGPQRHSVRHGGLGSGDVAAARPSPQRLDVGGSRRRGRDLLSSRRRGSPPSDRRRDRSGRRVCSGAVAAATFAPSRDGEIKHVGVADDDCGLSVRLRLLQARGERSERARSGWEGFRP